MKIFKVTIDNNPGGWKSGQDPYLIVIAKDEDEAIQKVKNGWSETWRFDDGKNIITYKEKLNDTYSYYNKKSELSVSEIKFEGYDIQINTIRKAKLDKINKESEV